jgi:ATP-binding cassette subfamily B protein/ATP-binding cassette subfamily C protein
MGGTQMGQRLGYPLGRTLKRMLKNVAALDKGIFWGFGWYTIFAAVYPFFGVILPKLLIQELVKGQQADINKVIYIVTGFFAASAIFGFGKTYIENACYPRLTALRIDYLRDMFIKLVTMDYSHTEDASFYERNGKAMEANSNNDNGMEGSYHKLFEMPAIALTMVVLMVFIGRVSPLILMGLCINAAAVIWIRYSVSKYQYSRKKDLSHSERRKKYYYNTTHDFGYGKDIRLYGFKDRILSNYNKEIQGYVGIYRQIYNKEYLLGFAGLLTLLISDALTYGILIYKTVNGMSIADFSMYLASVLSLSLAMRNLSEKAAVLIQEGQYVWDFYCFLDSDLGEKGGEKKAIEDDTLEVVFDNVSFKYPGTDKYIFKNLNFTIHKGERLAIVGINGAGKSTLVKLMTGLFDVTEGEIRINGIPLKEFDSKELFSMFSVVFQDVNIIAYSLLENVACTSEDVDREKAKAALKKAGLGDKLKELDRGLDTMMLKIIDENGTEFSGGQNQKLAIAKALYKDANMVIMDEPTAALDALAEAEIYESFSDLVKGKTAVYISHRLASTKFCDKIALFDNDGLKEYGSHEELMEAKGDYYNMFTVQGKYYNQEGEEENE